MMDQESALQYFSRDARYVVGGAITQKDKMLSLSWFIGKTGVLAVMNVRRAASEKRYH
jgi:hypothetical protein